MFGQNPGNENPKLKALAIWIIDLEQQHEIVIDTVVLDSCWSAAELKNPPKSVNNDSTARTLSRILGPTCKVIGFNGKANNQGDAGYISNLSCGKQSYGDNAVVFEDGKVIKGTTNTSKTAGIEHTTDYIKLDHELYNKMNIDVKSGKWRSNSFSKASKGNPM